MTWTAERPFGKIFRSFWTDPEMASLTPLRRHLLTYYFTAPDGNLIGLYHAPFETTAALLGLTLPSVKHWTLFELRPWVSYDLATREILVHNAARAALENTLHGGDKRRKAVERLIAKAHSERLRRLFLHLYSDWEVQVPVDSRPRSPIPSPSEGASKPLPSPMPSPSDRSRSRRRSRRREEPSVANATGAAPRAASTDGPTDGELMGLIRVKLYIPDGKGPLGYHEGRDVLVIRSLRKLGLNGYEISDAIEGMAMLRDRGELPHVKRGEKATMRALYNQRHGARPLLYAAQEAVWQTHKRVGPAPSGNDKGPQHISVALDQIVPRPPT